MSTPVHYFIVQANDTYEQCIHDDHYTRGRIDANHF